MTTTIQADPLPLRLDEDGVIRVGDSRITLDTILAEHKKGSSPETIAQEFDTLQLADVYAAIAYALRHPTEVAAYLERREEEAEAMRNQVEAAGMTRLMMRTSFRHNKTGANHDANAS